MEEKNLDDKYMNSMPIPAGNMPAKQPDSKEMEKMKKELDETKKKLEEFKKNLLKKFKFISAIGLIPPQANQIIEEAEELEESKEKILHLVVIIPDDKENEYDNVKKTAIELTKNIKPRVWIHLKTMKDLWEIAMNSRFDYMEAIGMSFALHDTGILGSIRVAEIHKSLVLKKFEKYVTSYVIAGSLVRGQASETSDIDVYVIIDDTDVRKMSRFELKEKLRAIIYQQVQEAATLAGVQNKLSPQIYIFTEFWESIKDATPVIFTFVRDGIPLYDRGAFLPWKMLLKMGKIKPSPEAIDMYMQLGDKMKNMVDNRATDIFMNDIYWGVITPSQAALMLYGMAPPAPKEIQQGIFRKVFVEKEKMLEKKYADILEEIVGLYKQLEHDPKMTITGKRIDEMLEKALEYNKRLKELVKQIENDYNEKMVVKVYDEVFDLLKKILKKNSVEDLLKSYKKELVEKGHITAKSYQIIENIIKAKQDVKKGKMTKHDVDVVRKNSVEVINMLLDYAQRKEFIALEKGKIRFIYSEKGVKKEASAIILDDCIFVIKENKIEKVCNGKVKEAKKEELEAEMKEAKQPRLSSNNLDVLRKLFSDFEILF